MTPAIIIFLLLVILETALLKKIIKSNWKESLKFCCLANFCSAVSCVVLLFSIIWLVKILSSNYELVNISFYLLSWLVLPVIIVWIENAIYKRHWKDVSQRKLLGTVIIINLITYIIFAVFLYFMENIDREKRFQRFKQIYCNSNLIQIGLSLKQYAKDNDGWLPDKSEANGFEQLRSKDYLTDYKVYTCPSSNRRIGRDKQPLTGNTVGYIYRSGYRDNDRQASKTPVVWDKPTNHDNYGNVLFLDGHVKGFKGKDWMEQAGIKKEAIEARMTSQSQYKLNEPHYLKRFYTQKELNRILKVGISPQDVINVFGLPMIKHNNRFTYRLDFNHKISPKNKEAIVGFTVYFCNGKVVSWGMIYTSRPSK
jgi:prepilin-type processing-associated H-X9-DG protein